MSLLDRWAFDDQYGDAGLTHKPLPPVSEALSLACHHDEPEPWDRYMEMMDSGDETAHGEWEKWFRRYQRERGRPEPAHPEDHDKDRPSGAGQ